MRHLEKRALSLLLALLLCITLFPAAALAEEGSIRPVENEENGGLSGTPAPTEEDEPGTIVGDGVLDVPSGAYISGVGLDRSVFGRGKPLPYIRAGMFLQCP